MKKISIYILICFFSMVNLFLQPDSFAKDVHVKGYYKKNGTYVKPYVRSQIDGRKSNNDDLSQADVENKNLEKEDFDHDVIPDDLDQADDDDDVCQADDLTFNIENK